MQHTTLQSPQPTHSRSAPHFRSGAVARLAGMPVSTLRIWEQRYQAVGPHTSPTGHRLYSSEDVERVVLLRQLTAQGHAIGSLATLDLTQLQQLLAMAQATSANAAAASVAPVGAALALMPQSNAPLHSGPLRLVVVGQTLAQRLQRLSLVSRKGTAFVLVAVFDSLEQALEAAGDGAARKAPIDVLVWQTAGLQVGQWPALAAAQQALQAHSVAVAYRFSGEAARDALSSAGAVLVREPDDDDGLADWMDSLAPSAGLADATSDPRARFADPQAWLSPVLDVSGAVAPARRFDDATVAAFGALSSGVACDCPQHVADLLTQMAAFEAYSADCQHNSPADAALHAYLLRVAGSARVLFETALERVAATEGWPIPPRMAQHN